jgi:predicted membrane-bound dolichyl-phosphate-mannose-protein mannosyltransferase
MENYNNKSINLYMPLLLFLITIISRIPFTSEFLYHMDSVHFALALEKYDITTHQPHPPGYFLYVMLGRLLNLFIEDANTVFVTISIVFSGFAVVAIYYLAKEIFDKKTGLLAAAIAITSPNVWFHGEVALTYIVEAFFSTAIAYLCWKIYKGRGQGGGADKYIYFSAIALGLAGGIRQNSIIFLLPLWLLSIKGLPLRKIIISFVLLGIVCLAWFLPMIQMTGGYDVYREAFRELWLFNTGNVSVFERGWDSFKVFSSTLFDFTIYGLYAGILIWILSIPLFAYSLIRHRRRLSSLDKSKVLFFLFWILPSIMFYLLIFIHPANPGYTLIFLPALLMLVAASIGYVSENIRQFFKRDLSIKIALFVISINTAFFFITSYPVTYREIQNHKKDLTIMLNEIKAFDSSRTAIFVGPYIFYGYRQIMHYLPEYRVYQVDVRFAPTGEGRKTFWGLNRETFLTDKIVAPDGIDSFISVLISEDKDKAKGANGISVQKLRDTNIYIASGDISLVNKIYPELMIKPQ